MAVLLMEEGMMNKIFLAVTLILFAMPVQASYDEKLQELLKINGAVAEMAYEAGEKIDNKIATMVNCMFNVPKSEEENVKKNISRQLDYKNKSNEIVIQVWKDNFTEEEIDEILAFYKTKTGRKTVALTPKISQDIRVEIMKYQQESALKLKDISTELQAKYGQRSEEEAKLCLRNVLR